MRIPVANKSGDAAVLEQVVQNVSEQTEGVLRCISLFKSDDRRTLRNLGNRFGRLLIGNGLATEILVEVAIEGFSASPTCSKKLTVSDAVPANLLRQ